MVVGYLASDDGAGGCIHDESDVVGFISSEYISFFVRMLFNEGFITDRGCLTVICDLLVWNGDVV